MSHQLSHSSASYIAHSFNMHSLNTYCTPGPLPGRLGAFRVVLLPYDLTQILQFPSLKGKYAFCLLSLESVAILQKFGVVSQGHQHSGWTVQSFKKSRSEAHRPLNPSVSPSRCPNAQTCGQPRSTCARPAPLRREMCTASGSSPRRSSCGGKPSTP